MQCRHQVKMDENVHRAGFIQQKAEYVEFLCAGSHALDSLTAALGELQGCTPHLLGCHRHGDRPGPGSFDFWCMTWTCRPTALPTHRQGLEVCLTWVQLLALQFASCENMEDSLWVSFFICVNDYGYNSHQI